ALELRGQIIEKHALLECGRQPLDAHRMTQAEKIDAAQAERYPGAECGGARRGVEGGGASADARQLRPKPEGEGIQPRLVQVKQDVLVLFIRIGILNRRLYLGKNAQIVELLLTIGNAALRNRVARAQLDSLFYQAEIALLQA